jgi:hypothetical protein
VERSVVTVQSDRANIVEDVRIAVGRASQPDEPVATNGG